MMYDKDFLLQLDKSKNKTIFARITALTFDELPVETIEGRVTQGSVNIDGSSAVRRTCSLSMVAQDFQYNDFYWGLNTKFKLEIGVENTINKFYPDIIWFKQGIFLITSFNTSHSTNNFSISIQGKDKMSLLNGEIGGTLESSIDFGTIEEESIDGIWTIRKIPIPEIIRNAVHTHGGEPLHNIIINDLDTYGLELLEYRYDKDLYLYRSTNDMIYRNVTLDGKKSCIVKKTGETKTLDSLLPQELEMLVDPFTGTSSDTVIIIDNQEWYVAKVSYGQTAGYRETDLTYAGDLIANVGESLTSILDKIKNMLAEFEYFYDIDGRFIFQKKQSFISTMWSLADDGPSAVQQQALVLAQTYAYKFSGSELITSFNNNPNLLNLRNDYSIWGERTGISGAKIPVHIRYAIDRKPVAYTQIRVETDNTELKNYNTKYNAKIQGRENAKTFYPSGEYKIDGNKIYCDWREVIYQMALDFYKYNMLSDLEQRIYAANPDLYADGRTGYENYYTDLQGFWRQLYNPDIDTKIEEIDTELDEVKDTRETLASKIEYFKTQIIRLDQDNGKASEIRNEVIVVYDGEYKEQFKGELDTYILMALLKNVYNQLKDQDSLFELKEKDLEAKKAKREAEKENYYDDGDKLHWNRMVYEKPEQLNFWFDFLDSSNGERELSKYDIKNIGSRPKAINDTNVKSIYFRETPNIIYVSKKDKIDELPGYKYIQCGGIDGLFSISAQGKSAKDRLDELLYQHSYCIESATITTIPIYYLEPNTRIYIHDEKSGLDGDYIVSKISLPLSYNGTMQITATKAAENIIT